MSELAFFVGNLLACQAAAADRLGNGGARAMRRLGDDNRRAILEVMARAGRPVGPALLASETGLTRSCVCGHLDALASRGLVSRISPALRSPWALARPA